MAKSYSPLPPRSYTYSLTLGLISAFSLFLLTGLFSCQKPLLSDTSLPPTVSSDSERILEPLSQHVSPSPLTGTDQSQTIRLERSDGSIETLSLEDYLWGVVAAEMPASFPLEALKAQAVAARSYTALRIQNSKHSDAHLCDDSACCQAYIDQSTRLSSWGTDAPFYQEKIATAIHETDGLYVLYQGEPIDALFFSSSAGQTLDAEEVWGTPAAYLQSVASPDQGQSIPLYESEVLLTATQVRETVLDAYPSADFSTEETLWFQDWRQDSTGGLAQVTLGGVTLTGSQVRSLFALRSTHITLDHSEEGFRLSVIGYGHNVGMSQYGAKAMAEEGSHFDEILQWYYSNTTVSPYPHTDSD